MAQDVDLYSTYGSFNELVLDAIRKETFGIDIGQNSWVTAEEYDRFISWLDLRPDDQVLEVASGSGGPALYLARRTGCRMTGIDANESAIANASRLAAASEGAAQPEFSVADATARLPFEDGRFDALLCIDAMNHFPNRLSVLRDWHRILREGGRAVFTDPVVVTGPVTNIELEVRSSIGLFLFVPPGINERLIEEAGFRLVLQEDVTENAALVSGRWQRAREARKAELIRMEGEQRYDGLQRFFGAVHSLTSERRLSRIVYVAEKPPGRTPATQA
jgi:SAM-dependent methyltransferase